jgi:hypothetical protein
MTNPSHREIPYNYTSADDRQAVSALLGRGIWKKLEELRGRRVTGRSARLLMRVFGEVLVHRRNPYLRQELVTSSRRRKRFFGDAEANLRLIQEGAGSDSEVLEVLAEARSMLDGVREEVRRTPELHARLRRALGAVVGRENRWLRSSPPSAPWGCTSSRAAQARASPAAPSRSRPTA